MARAINVALAAQKTVKKSLKKQRQRRKGDSSATRSTSSSSPLRLPQERRRSSKAAPREILSLPTPAKALVKASVKLSSVRSEGVIGDAHVQVPVKPTPQPKFNVRDLEAIVINLERRPDRMGGCVARFQAYAPWLQYSRFLACDGKVTPMKESEVVNTWETHRNVVYQKKRSIRKGWDDLNTYNERTLLLSAGERGCAISHVRAWEECLARAGDSERPLLVLEDDAAPTPEFSATLTRAMDALPDDAHVLYLGYSQAADWRREVSPDVVEAEYVWTTVGYIVWPAGARILLSKLPVDQPVDNFMANLCATRELNSYCVRPKIVHQAEAWNVNSDVGHSDEQYWGPCSDIPHSDEFYWGPFAEHGGEYELPATAGGDAVGGFPNAVGSLFWDIDSEDDSMDDA